MGNNSLSVIQSINLAVLTPIVCKSLHLDRFEIQSWKVSPIKQGAGNPVNLGLYRFEGTGQDQDDNRIPWSVILKIIQSPANAGVVNFGEAADPTHWNGWKREEPVYSSELLETLPNGMAAPSCFGKEELPGNIIRLWLEDVQGTSHEYWPLDL
jgi:hypothetical protein